MKIAIGADHGGYELKARLLASFRDCQDMGCYDPEACDYSDYADDVAMAVAKGDADLGVLLLCIRITHLLILRPHFLSVDFQ